MNKNMLEKFVLQDIGKIEIFDKKSNLGIGEVKIYSYKEEGICGQINIYNLKNNNSKISKKWVSESQIIPDTKKIQSFYNHLISLGVIDMEYDIKLEPNKK